MKTFGIIGGTILVIVLLVYFAGGRERDKLRDLMVNNSCYTEAMESFHRTATSRELDSAKRADEITALFTEFMEKGKEINFDRVMDLPNDKKVSWVNAVTREIEETCPARIQEDFEVRCYVSTLLNFSNSQAAALNRMMAAEARQKDVFKGLCIQKRA